MGGVPPTAECGSAQGIRRANPVELPLILDSAKIGALIGRVGNGPWFKIGEQARVTAQTNGELFLLFNDRPCCYGDNSGHVRVNIYPGLPLGMAPAAYVLWTKFLRHNPKNPKWFNRDRFLLSAGHGSMLIYSLLHLTGYDLPLDELKNFRQLHSKTPGHPENILTPGVEITTGPLGQGFANGVGMGIAQKHLAGDVQSKEAFR